MLYSPSRSHHNIEGHACCFLNKLLILYIQPNSRSSSYTCFESFEKIQCTIWSQISTHLTYQHIPRRPSRHFSLHVHQRYNCEHREQQRTPMPTHITIMPYFIYVTNITYRDALPQIFSEICMSMNYQLYTRLFKQSRHRLYIPFHHTFNGILPNAYTRTHMNHAWKSIQPVLAVFEQNKY